MLRTLLVYVSVILLAAATWLGLNYAKSVVQARNDQAILLNAIIQVLQYNMQTGHLVPLPAASAQAPASNGLQSDHPRAAPDTAR